MSKIVSLIPRLTVSSIGEVPAVGASAAPRQSTRVIHTGPQAFRGVPTEPRALRIPLPRLQSSCWERLTGPRATSVDPFILQETSQVDFLSNSAPRSSLGMLNQVEPANSLVYNGNTGSHIDTDHLQPLQAAASSPPPSRGDGPR